MLSEGGSRSCAEVFGEREPTLGGMGGQEVGWASARGGDAVRPLRAEGDAVHALADAAEVPQIGSAVPEERLRRAARESRIGERRAAGPKGAWRARAEMAGIGRDACEACLDDLAAAVAAGDDALAVVAPVEVVDAARHRLHFVLEGLVAFDAPDANLARLRYGHDTAILDTAGVRHGTG